MLPFLKDRQEGGASSEAVETKRMGGDDNDEYGMIDAIVDDLLDAVHKKDKKLLKDSLLAFCEYIEDKDEIQDEQEFE